MQYAVKIKSKLVNDDLVVFKGKGLYKRVRSDYPNSVIYFEKEIELLSGMDGEVIKAAHDVKRIFNNSWITECEEAK